jgi:Ca2+-binding EF-hand superfamily protein
MAMTAVNRKHDLWFDTWDTDCDGGITREDLHTLCQQAVDHLGYPSDSAKVRQLVDVYNTFWESLVREADTNRDGIVSRTEFWAAMERQGTDLDEFEQVLRPVAEAEFALIDVDNSGVLSAEEYARWMRLCGLSAEAAEIAGRAMESTANGQITKEEYAASMRQYLTSDDLDSPASQMFGPLQ